MEPSPLFQRPVTAVASYNSPPPFSAVDARPLLRAVPARRRLGAEIQQRLENNSYAAIPTTSVHEAYPGHHWQLVMAKGNPSRVRRTFRHAVLHRGLGPVRRAGHARAGLFHRSAPGDGQYEATLFRAARIIVDTSLHIGDMSFDEAVEFMRTRANLPEPTARAEVTRYCAWPTQASAYLTGCLEILRIRDHYLTGNRAACAISTTPWPPAAACPSPWPNRPRCRTEALAPIVRRATSAAVAPRLKLCRCPGIRTAGRCVGAAMLLLRKPTA